MKLERKNVKALIELSTSFEEADEVIKKYTDFKDLKEKIAYIKGMFDVEILDSKKDDPDELIYRLLLTAVVEKKWH